MSATASAVVPSPGGARHRLIRLLAAVACAATPVAALASPAGAGAATPASGVFAGKLATKAPPGARVHLRAIDGQGGRAAAARVLPASGAFRLTLPPGVYLVAATTVTRDGRVSVTKTGLSLRAGQRRLGATLGGPAGRRPGKRPASTVKGENWRQQGGQVSPGRVAVEIPDLTGAVTDPDWAAVRTGINDMLVTEVMKRTTVCGGVDLLEVDRRADLLKEIELQRSRYFDPATRVKPNFIIGDVEVRGTVADAPGGAGDVTLRIVDIASGETLGTLAKRVTRDAFFPDFAALGADLGDELCKLTDVYDVTMDLTGTAVFATHDSSATLRTTITARRGTGAEDGVWRGTAGTVWDGLTFTSKTPCSYTDLKTTEFVWSVEIRRSGPDAITVTWGQENLGPTSYPTASMVCLTAPPIPGQPGPSLVGATPQTFTLPAAGGSVPVPNGITTGGLGYFTNGSVTVRPKGAAVRR